jgi:4-aminobutyrate aminotransferase-like enzyme
MAGGNPVCCAAGLAVLDEIERLSLMSHARDVGKHLKSRLSDLAETADGALIGQVRGTGLFLGIEFVRDRQTHEPATEETSWLCSRLKVSRHALKHAHRHTHTHTHTHSLTHSLTDVYPSHTYTRL